MKLDDMPTDVRTEAMRMLTNGVYVLTACHPDAIHAATVSWATQASFQPPLILVALRRNSHLALAVRKAHRFAVNILSDEQQDVAARYFDHRTEAIAESEAAQAFRMTASRCPLLTDAMAWIECRLAAEPPSPGDHALLLGEVTGAGLRRPGQPMVLWSTPWSYGGIRES